MIATNFLLSFNPVWSMVDLNGIQANDSFYMWVLTNTIPYIPQNVFEDAGGTIPWGVPIQFLANGTLPINIYWDENATYRLEIRQNLGLAPPSQSDPLIYLIENYIPIGGAQGSASDSSLTTSNQVTNPQFAIVNFDNTYTLNAATNPNSIEVGPDWYLDLVGTGNVFLEQVELNTTVNSITNAPYALNINVGGGWTAQPILRQRFYQNGLNWQGKTIAISLTATINGPPQNIFVRLDASNGQPLGIILNATLGPEFTEYQGNMVIPMFTNLDLPPDAYIDLKIFLPPVADIYITSIQLTESANVGNVEYQQDTVNRQIDHTFHYYQSKLNYKPIPSYLVGWDFPLNPTQELGPTVPQQNTGANTGFYAWDQTIVFQTVTSGVSVSRGTQGSLQLTAQANGQIALIQYLDEVTARKIINDRASIHMSGFTNVPGGLIGNVSLWATTGALPNVATGTNLTLITALDASGIPTVAAGWTQIPNVYQNTNFTLEAQSATNSEMADISLNGWDLMGAAPSTTATYFAIVVGFAAWVTTNTVNFNSISLCSGDIATRPAPKTPDETLQNCQYFYWKTFMNSIPPAQNVGSGTGEFMYPNIKTGAGTVYAPQVVFPQPLRVAPTVTFYNPIAANASVTTEPAGPDIGGAAATLITNQSFAFATGSGGATVGLLLGVHITADARLGIV